MDEGLLGAIGVGTENLWTSAILDSTEQGHHGPDAEGIVIGTTGLV